MELCNKKIIELWTHGYIKYNPITYNLIYISTFFENNFENN